jgi:4-diphosphocytidyl-2-C-methyl-D-erythritol kinase
VSLTGLAPAKINLFLHVGPVQADGYHPLASLVAFADIGDRVTVERADALSLSVEGPFGEGLAAEPDNLILKALRALGQAAGIGEPGLHVTLDKQLPIAAGLGGGSSDAGTALKLARDLLGLDLDDAALEAVAGVVGADGPMCLRARSAWAEGRGDVLTVRARPAAAARRPRQPGRSRPRPAPSIAPSTPAPPERRIAPSRLTTGALPPSSTGWRTSATIWSLRPSP